MKKKRLVYSALCARLEPHLASKSKRRGAYADGGSIQNRRFWRILSGYSRADYVRIRIGMSKNLAVSVCIEDRTYTGD